LVEAAGNQATDHEIQPRLLVRIDDAGRVAAEFQHHPLFSARALSPHPIWPPVNDSSFRRSSVTNGSASSMRQGRIENEPVGKSVSTSTSPMISAPIGVRSEGFSTNGQPAAIAGATLCATRFNGKLNGVMKEHGPSGTRLTKPRYPLVRSEISRFTISPSMRVDSSAAIRKVSIRRSASPCESLIGLPASTHSA